MTSLRKRKKGGKRIGLLLVVVKWFASTKKPDYKIPRKAFGDRKKSAIRLTKDRNLDRKMKQNEIKNRNENK